MKAYLVRGVPASIQQDGWWMDGFEPARHGKPARVTRRRFWITAAGLAVLTLLAALGQTALPQRGFPTAPASHSLSPCPPQETTRETTL